MTLNKLILTALLALASVAGSGGYEVTRAASTAPCAPVLDETPKPRIEPPTGLKIIRAALSYLVDFEAEPGSGPYVAPELATATTGTGPHGYFDMLSVRGDCMVAYSLRDADQLFNYAQSTAKPQDVTYDPAGDRDPRRQDAAKVLIPADKVSLPNNIQLPIPPVDAASLLVTWDSWLGHEFAHEYTGIANYKHFQLTSPAGRIWTEVKADFNEAEKYKPAIAMIEMRFYGEKKNGEAGPNVELENPLSPQLTKFGIMPETWTRYWVYLNPVGGWHELSLWVSDENRAPVLIIDRLQVKPNYGLGATGWEKFWLEYNTSDLGLPTFGARVAYARNVVMLRGVSNPSALLEKPVR